jgi:hypothetical protein
MKEKTIAQISGMLTGWVVAALVVVAFTVGCTSNSSGPVVSSNDITYSKDAKTGICFATMNSLDGHSGWKTTSITYVPCTPEVEKAIAK